MPDDDLDPGASTEMFQAFVERSEEPLGAESRWISLVLVAVAVAVALSVLVWLLLAR